jgi:hypothetical protein
LSNHIRTRKVTPVTVRSLNVQRDSLGGNTERLYVQHARAIGSGRLGGLSIATSPAAGGELQPKVSYQKSSYEIKVELASLIRHSRCFLRHDLASHWGTVSKTATGPPSSIFTLAGTHILKLSRHQCIYSVESIGDEASPPGQ